MRPVNKVQGFLAKRASQMRKNPTPAEKRAKQILESMGVHFRFQRYCYRKLKYRIFDFYIPGKKIAIEIDGGYHDPEYDRRRDAEFLAARPAFKIVRIPNREIFRDGENLLRKAIFG